MKFFLVRCPKVMLAVTGNMKFLYGLNSPFIILGFYYY